MADSDNRGGESIVGKVLSLYVRVINWFRPKDNEKR